MRSHRLQPRAAQAGRRAPEASIGDVAVRIAAPTSRPALTRAALLGGVWLGALGALCPDLAHAQVSGTWIGPGPSPGPGAEWTNDTNWSSSPTVPDNTATFTNNGAVTSVTISNSTSINTIAFDALAPAYTFTVSGAIFTINNGITNNSSSLPTFSIDSSATLSFAGNSNTTFAGTITGTGTLEIDDSALLTLTGRGSDIGAVVVCNCDSNGLTINGGSLNVTDPTPFVGGTFVEGGTLSVINGGALQTTNLVVSSALLISGPGSTVTVSPTGITEISSFVGPASVTIANGGLLSAPGGAAIDAANPDFIPTVTVTGAGSTWNVGTGLAVGGGGSFGGPGILTISNGGVVNSTGLTGIGDPTGSSAVTVTGAGSILNASSLVVGDTSCGLIGTLTVADGGVVNSPGFTGIAQGSTLNLGVGGRAGAINTPAIDNEGQIVANFTDTLTLAADISGPGTLSKAGVGTLILTGNNSYAGGTTRSPAASSTLIRRTASARASSRSTAAACSGRPATAPTSPPNSRRSGPAGRRSTPMATT
jgi:fibronectin-binding autotransporter adhesin